MGHLWASHRLATEGFDREAVDASLNPLEFRLREFDTGGSPEGLSLMLAATGRWVYGQDPLEALRYEAPLAELKRELAANGHDTLFKRMLGFYLLDNPHRVAVTLSPDPTMERRVLAEERERLAAIKSKWSQVEVDDAVRATHELKSMQAPRLLLLCNDVPLRQANFKKVCSSRKTSV